MSDPRSIVLVGKPAYYWSYLAPVAREFQRRFHEPVTAVALEGAFSDDPALVRRGTLRPYRRARVAVAFDVWSMIAARACARTVLYVHHSLVGKGLVFRGSEPFRPFMFADTLCLPLPDRARDVPDRTREKVRITGHPPFDWLGAETPLPRWQETLRAWGDGGRRLRVAVLCTHGEFGSVHLLDGIAGLPLDGLDLGVKLHGYLGKRALPAGMRDLGDCPTALVVQHSDLVVTDHSTAAVEAHLLGVPCICYRSDALERLRLRHPALSEFAYLEAARCYRTVPELAALLKDPPQRRAPAAGMAAPGVRSASAQLIDLCTEAAA